MRLGIRLAPSGTRAVRSRISAPGLVTQARSSTVWTNRRGSGHARDRHSMDRKR